MKERSKTQRSKSSVCERPSLINSSSQLLSPRASNIKVLARFRPLIDFETAFSDNEEIVSFINSRTIGISCGKEMETFTLDRIFDPNSKQAEIFDFIGRQTIQDVLDGYNGTIFAYGQTGSGKTYTMMGFDIYDEEAKGIIPRAASQIFESVKQDSGEIEYTLRCSMLEIYKETIRDLLDPDNRALSIKECPRRGIYVQGLNEVCIASEKDILDVLTLGETMRTVASTKLNKASSRSHMIFMLEVLQKLPNDSEKRGILNLVDLAGSEKVSNSGVTGNNLEETKKINFSLSALGNVIHALVSNSDHIPYRDSKLTRLLQESLGGNYKTSLIVACSSFSKSIEETLNTLKFAIRAKAVKNKAKINIKNSPENYMKIIQQLRTELSNAKSEISLLKEEKALTVRDYSMNQSLNNSLFLSKNLRATMSAKKDRPKNSRQYSSILSGIDNILDENKEKSSIFESSLALSFNNTSEKTSLESENDGKLTDRETNDGRNTERDGLGEDLETTKKRCEFLEEENKALNDKIKRLEAKICSSKAKRLKIEQKAHDYYESLHKITLQINKESSKNSLLLKQNDALNKQVRRLTNALKELDLSYKAFIENHSKLEGDITFVEFEDKSEIHEKEIPNESHNTELDLSGDFELCLSPKRLFIDPQSLVNTSIYAQELKNALEYNAELSKDITIYQLRNQVIQAGICNSNITRIMNGLDWKLNLVNQKYKLKRNLCKNQCEQISSLEAMIDNLHESYQKIVKLQEQIDQGPRRILINESTTTPRVRFIRSFTSNLLKNNMQIVKSQQEFVMKSSESQFISCPGSFIENDSADSGIFLMKYKALETSYNLQQLYNAQLKKSNQELKNQALQYQKLLEKLECDIFKAQKTERERWKSFFSEMKENCEKELVRKQLEIAKLNNVLGEWTTRYMELQDSYGNRPKKLNMIFKQGDDVTPKSTLNIPDNGAYMKVLFQNSPLNSNRRASPGPPIRRDVLPGDKTPPQFF
ncbi:unnamed protein product [Blepharisma stoltei]|uniref:Kinesin motor domain-containing protein n=1 Tax=Blepharisma stoltei TaxID=1481888 RepID=A0AAU9JV83_9CILI|nr:unnamed protein product [Blepharisma stoltei]